MRDDIKTHVSKAGNVKVTGKDIGEIVPSTTTMLFTDTEVILRRDYPAYGGRTIIRFPREDFETMLEAAGWDVYPLEPGMDAARCLFL